MLVITSCLAWASIYVCRLLSDWIRVEFCMRHRSGIPKGPAFFEALQFAGVRDPHRIMTRWIKRFGPVFWYHLGPYHVVHLTDPFLVADVCRTTGAYDKPAVGYSGGSQATSSNGRHNLITSPQNEHWRLVRRAVVPAFNAACLKRAFPAINSVVTRFISIVEELNPSQPFNASEALLNMAMDVIGVFGFNCNMGGLDSLKPDYRGVDKARLSVDAFEEAAKRGLDVFRQWRFRRVGVRKGKRAIREYQALMKALLKESQREAPQGVVGP
eukprot:jgi/Botrbrau1/9262/Bobra.180_1s0019.1